MVPWESALMMNPLDHLHDIQVTEPVAFAPVSWGWWLLFGLILGVVIYILVLLAKRRQQQKLKQQILTQLEQADSLLAIHTLVRRATLMLWPSAAVAALTGRPWQEFWLATWPAKEQINVADDYEQITAALYRPQPADELVEHYRKIAMQWVAIAWWPRLITMKREVR